MAQLSPYYLSRTYSYPMNIFSITRGSTVQMRFDLDVYISDLDKIEVSLKNGSTLYAWDKSKMTLGDTWFSASISQEQTLALDNKERCYIQVRAKFKNSDVSVSDVSIVKVNPFIGKDEKL